MWVRAAGLCGPGPVLCLTAHTQTSGARITWSPTLALQAHSAPLGTECIVVMCVLDKLFMITFLQLQTVFFNSVHFSI